MRRRCVPLGIIAGLGVLMLLLLPVQAQAKRRSVQANSVSALEQATKKLEKTGGIIWLGTRTYRLKKSIMIPSNITIRGRKKTVIDGSMLKGRTAFVTKDSKEVHVRWIILRKCRKEVQLRASEAGICGLQIVRLPVEIMAFPLKAVTARL